MEHYIQLVLDRPTSSGEPLPVLIDINKINYLLPAEGGGTIISLNSKTLRVMENFESIVTRIRDLEVRNTTGNNRKQSQHTPSE